MVKIIPHKSKAHGLTYARRYSVQLAFGLATTDDDAQIFDEVKDTKPSTSTKISKTLAKSIEQALKNKGCTEEQKVAILGKYGYESFEDIETKYYPIISKEIQKVIEK